MKISCHSELVQTQTGLQKPKEIDQQDFCHQTHSVRHSPLLLRSVVLRRFVSLINSGLCYFPLQQPPRRQCPESGRSSLGRFTTRADSPPSRSTFLPRKVRGDMTKCSGFSLFRWKINRCSIFHGMYEKFQVFSARPCPAERRPASTRPKNCATATRTRTWERASGPPEPLNQLIKRDISPWNYLLPHRNI